MERELFKMFLGKTYVESKNNLVSFDVSENSHPDPISYKTFRQATERRTEKVWRGDDA